MAISRVWMDCRNKRTHGLRPAMMRTSHEFGSCDECIYNDGEELVYWQCRFPGSMQQWDGVVNFGYHRSIFGNFYS
jgi:hypothetical protein